MIERCTSKIETVYIPQQRYKHVSNASIGLGSVEVIEIKQAFFLTFINIFATFIQREIKMIRKEIWVFREWCGLISEKEKRRLKVN